MNTAMVDLVGPLFAESMTTGMTGALVVVLGLVLLVVINEALGLRYIANNRVGVVETLWSAKGSIPEGGIIALGGEAGFQADILRGGFHFGLWRWQYKIHKVPLVTVSQGKIGYVYARDGTPLQPSQTLGKVVPCNNFQDARGFLTGESGVARAGDRAGDRTARPPAGLPSRRGVRDQPRPVPGDHRGIRLSARNRRPARAQDDRRLADGAEATSTVSAPSWSVGRSRLSRPVHAREDDDGRQHRRRDRPGRPVARPRRDHRPGRRLRPQREGLSQQLPGPRGVPPRGGPPGLAVPLAHRRHLLHQPLVRHRRARSPRRSSRSATSASWSATTAASATGRLGRRLPPRRAGRRG